MLFGLKTDNPEAELYLLEKDGTPRAAVTWHADRALARQLLMRIDEFLRANNTDVHALTGIVVFRGPGSFTGLRIGITVANTLAYTLGIPVVGAEEEDWLTSGVHRLQAQTNDQVVLPHYGAPPRITAAKK